MLDALTRPATRPAPAHGGYHPCRDRYPLFCLDRGRTEPPMEVRHPNEFTLLVVAPQRAENDLVPVQAGMAASPLIDARRRLDVPRGGPPLLVPPLGTAGDQVGRELIDEY